jgi:hypothetical protein
MGKKNILQIPPGIIKNKENLECYIIGLEIQFSKQPLYAWPSSLYSITD